MLFVLLAAVPQRGRKFPEVNLHHSSSVIISEDGASHHGRRDAVRVAVPSLKHERDGSLVALRILGANI